jgi:hypothetical protein
LKDFGFSSCGICEANCDKIKKDLENTLTTINDIYEKSDTNILWNTFKNEKVKVKAKYGFVLHTGLSFAL